MSGGDSQVLCGAGVREDAIPGCHHGGVIRGQRLWPQSSPSVITIKLMVDWREQGSGVIYDIRKMPRCRGGQVSGPRRDGQIGIWAEGLFVRKHKVCK